MSADWQSRRWTFKTPGHLAAWSCTDEPYPERPDLWEPGQYVAPEVEAGRVCVSDRERREFEAMLRSITDSPVRDD